MRHLQLGLGWIVLCGLTAAGTYFTAIEADQQFGLQAKLCKSCSVASGGTTPGPSAPGSGSNPPSSGNTPPGGGTAPPAGGTLPPHSSPTPPSPGNQQPGGGVIPPAGGHHPPGGGYQPPSGSVTPPSGGYQPPSSGYQPPPTGGRQINPVGGYTPPSSPHTPGNSGGGPDLSAVQARYNALVERARQVNNFYSQMESMLRQQDQQLRPELQAALSSMRQSVNEALANLRRGNGAAASQALDIAQQKVDFLEQSK